MILTLIQDHSGSVSHCNNDWGGGYRKYPELFISWRLIIFIAPSCAQDHLTLKYQETTKCANNPPHFLIGQKRRSRGLEPMAVSASAHVGGPVLVVMGQDLGAPLVRSAVGHLGTRALDTQPAHSTVHYITWDEMRWDESTNLTWYATCTRYITLHEIRINKPHLGTCALDTVHYITFDNLVVPVQCTEKSGCLYLAVFVQGTGGYPFECSTRRINKQREVRELRHLTSNVKQTWIAYAENSTCHAINTGYANSIHQGDILKI